MAKTINDLCDCPCHPEGRVEPFTETDPEVQPVTGERSRRAIVDELTLWASSMAYFFDRHASADCDNQHRNSKPLADYMALHHRQPLQ